MIRKAWMQRKPKASKPKEGRRTLEQMTYWDLIHILDAEYSFNLRAGMAAKLGTPWISCYTCGSIDHWKNMDCGHYHQRELMGVRFDTRNTRIQCHKCNRFSEGLKATYSTRLLDEIGLESMVALQQLADYWGKTHHATSNLIAWIKEYRAENARIRKEVRMME